MAGSSSVLKRLEALEQRISFRRSRMIVYEARAGTAESDHEAFLKEIAPIAADLVVCVSKFVIEPVPPPDLSVSPQCKPKENHPMSYPSDKPKSTPAARIGETRYAGERTSWPLKPNERDVNPEQAYDDQ